MAVYAERFFETQHTPSQVKSAIVSRYWGAWSGIMTQRAGKCLIGYLDLFAGPGRFEDGVESTPLLIMRKAAADPFLRRALKSFFNDKDAEKISSLQREIAAIDGITDLKHAPRFHSEAVSPQIVDHLTEFRAIPTLLFADPFGYMGISLQLVKQLLEDQKSEALIFFNTNRINPGISNEFVREHIDALFGEERAEAVRGKASGLHGDARERVVLNSFADGLKAIGFPYVLRFRFLSRTADRTSHHLFHCSRHRLAEKKMKDIMDRHSAKTFDGVPLFEIPQDDLGQPSLFDQPLPPVELARELVQFFAGRALTLPEIIGRHSPGTPYVERNYRAALWYLIDEGRVICEHRGAVRAQRQGKRIWPKGMRISFPSE